MTWEETIKFIRTQPEFNNLIEKAYFDANLPLNVERYRKSDEFIETLKLLKKFQPSAKTILDIGSGNGISAIAFAIEGYVVTSIEPDASDTIGAGAIRFLKKHYNLNNIEIFEAFAEEIKFPSENFDIVYARQCMHHAYDLYKFVAEAGRVLKKSGLFITVRDHVIFNAQDKEWFLQAHPLQKYYGGENAYTEVEYKTAITNSGLQIKQTLKHFDSPINYFPLTTTEKEFKENSFHQTVTSLTNDKLRVLSKIKFINTIVFKYVSVKLGLPFDEKKVPGRMYSFLAIK